MNHKLPADYCDYPRSYVGKQRQVAPELYGDFPDRANPQAPAGSDGSAPSANAAFGPLDTEGATGAKVSLEDSSGKSTVSPSTARPEAPAEIPKDKNRHISWRKRKSV